MNVKSLFQRVLTLGRVPQLAMGKPVATEPPQSVMRADAPQMLNTGRFAPDALSMAGKKSPSAQEHQPLEKYRPPRRIVRRGR